MLVWRIVGRIVTATDNIQTVQFKLTALLVSNDSVVWYVASTVEIQKDEQRTINNDAEISVGVPLNVSAAVDSDDCKCRSQHPLFGKVY